MIAQSRKKLTNNNCAAMPDASGAELRHRVNEDQPEGKQMKRSA